MSRSKIKTLVIDDDLEICAFFQKFLTQMGHWFKTANSIREAEAHSRENSFDLILLDLDLPDGNGVDILPDLLACPGTPEVIIITGTGDVKGAEIAFEYGAWDYVRKPFTFEEITLPITRALQFRKEKQSVQPKLPLIRSKIIGDSPPIRRCLEEVAIAAATDAGVMITGETGTGKELFARAVHENSHRADKPFVVINCGAIPESLVESTLFGHEKGTFTGASTKQSGLISQADSGTLMLDEVGDLPMSAQQSLLRTLQERVVRPIGSKKEIPVDIRLVAATNLDLDDMVDKKLFRQDLLFRLRTVDIRLPPLRDRGEDIKEIIFKKIHDLTRKYSMENKAVSNELIDVLSAYNWPGNVRELINVLDYALASAKGFPTLYPAHLPPKYRLRKLGFETDEREIPDTTSPSHLSDHEDDLPDFQTWKRIWEKNYMEKLMAKTGGNRKEACTVSKLSQSRLYDLIKKHGLSKS